MALKDTMMSILRALVVIAALYKSYTIRLYAVEVYGRVIHEFDPWFNFRATQYLVNNGWHAFFRWFDHSVWYPSAAPWVPPSTPACNSPRRTSSTPFARRLRRLPQRRVRLPPRRILYPRLSLHRGHRLRGGVEGTQVDRLRGHRRRHVRPARAPMRILRGRVRQRVHRRHRHRRHLLLVGSIPSNRTIVAHRLRRRALLLLHGGGVGRVHLRPRDDWRARGDPRRLRAIHLGPLQSLLHLSTSSAPRSPCACPSSAGCPCRAWSRWGHCSCSV